ncbi:hypothetical protein CEXT_435391 [Caerostris extrusa]|uniref:Uncharacterized protein n=1 Tax=Caerostris extrusa TaxID=172846 RepID=A0AAV4SI62_CAEEX|nr:hypothetical protein CEXT_435391 [Caerostris extrusa]
MPFDLYSFVWGAEPAVVLHQYLSLQPICVFYSTVFFFCDFLLAYSICVVYTGLLFPVVLSKLLINMAEDSDIDSSILPNEEANMDLMDEHSMDLTVRACSRH